MSEIFMVTLWEQWIEQSVPDLQIIKMEIGRIREWKCELDSCGSKVGTIAGSYEQYDEDSGFIKAGIAQSSE
jgi:hypothetical protein